MTVCEGEAGTGKTLKGQQSGIAGEVCMGLSQETPRKPGSVKVQSKLQAAQTEARVDRLALRHHSSSEGRAEGGLNRSSGKNSALCPWPLCASHVQGTARARDNETF